MAFGEGVDRGEFHDGTTVSNARTVKLVVQQESKIIQIDLNSTHSMTQVYAMTWLIL